MVGSKTTKLSDLNIGDEFVIGGKTFIVLDFIYDTKVIVEESSFVDAMFAHCSDVINLDIGDKVNFFNDLSVLPTSWHNGYCTDINRVARKLLRLPNK